jgi:hypothetical protein
LQWAQYLQFLQALQLALPVQVAAEIGPATATVKANKATRSFAFMAGYSHMLGIVGQSKRGVLSTLT